MPYTLRERSRAPRKAVRIVFRRPGRLASNPNRVEICRGARSVRAEGQADWSATGVIQVDGLCKSFLDYQRGWISAVTDISFECHPGAIFGLLGPNGAGKTTTLRILSTVLKPTSGHAVVAGYDVLTNPQAVRANIGYMSASTGIYDRMTAWELVEYFGRLYGMTQDRLTERMDTIFCWLKMNDFRDVLGSKMSTGMKQKVSIARTIVHDPPVLIFDEPTSGLDVLVARAVLQKILELRVRARRSSFRPTRCTRSRSSARASRSSIGAVSRPRGPPTSCCNGLTSRILKSYSSIWWSAPIPA